MEFLAVPARSGATRESVGAAPASVCLIAILAPRFAKLPAAQRKLWPALRPGVAMGFVLYGGTAVSLHLGHRRSIDFDFFNDRPLEAAAVRAAFGLGRSVQTLQQSRNTLVVHTAGVKVSFFGGLDFGRVGEPMVTRDGVAQIASLADLMAHKLKVILQRAEKKDYQDIAAMLAAGVPLDRGLAAARLMFGKSFQPAESLKALTWFKDGDLSGLSPAIRKTLIAASAKVAQLPKIKLQSRYLAARI